MKEAMARVDKEVAETLKSMKDGLYEITIHGYASNFKIENDKLFGEENKGGKTVWCETFMEPSRLAKLNVKQN